MSQASLNTPNPDGTNSQSSQNSGAQIVITSATSPHTEPHSGNPPENPTNLRWVITLCLLTVVGGISAYCLTYWQTKNTAKNWFVQPNISSVTPDSSEKKSAEDSAQIDEQSASYQPIISYINQSEENIADEENTADTAEPSIPNTKDIILNKKARFDLLSKEHENWLTELQANQKKILESTTNLETILKNLAASGNPNSAQSELFKYLQDIKNLNGQQPKYYEDLLNSQKRSYEQVRLFEQVEAANQGISRHAELAIHFYSQAKASIVEWH